MKKLLLFCFFAFPYLLIAQNKQDVLFTIDDLKIPLDEFLHAYQKQDQQESSSHMSIPEYLELYIPFKLKVHEARIQGMDKDSLYISEIEQYRNQLIQPYLTNKKIMESLIQEAYERMKWEINVSHILIKMGYDIKGRDTAEYYRKAIKIRNRLLHNEPFERLARSTSDDPSAKMNGGNLGSFTVFQMPYTFESAAYESDSGTITMPVRTRLGYHILKINDKRKALGKIKVAHIMITTPFDMAPEEKEKARAQIFSISEQLKEGADFYSLARSFSMDRATAQSGGELPWFGVGAMVPEFEQASFALEKDGQVSEPVKTSFGWHIIKRLGRQEMLSFKEAHPYLKRMFFKDSRSLIAKEAFVNTLKQQYAFKEFPDNINKMFDLLSKEDNLEKNKKLEKPIFTFAGQSFVQQDFVQYVDDHRLGKEPEKSPASLYRELYQNFVENKLLAYEQQQLESKYPEFRNTMKEYREGILLFNLTEKEIWNKVSNDSAGLNIFYEQHKSEYLSEPKANLVKVNYSDPGMEKKLRRVLKRKTLNQLSIDEIKHRVNASKNQISVETGTFEKSTEWLQPVRWSKGLHGPFQGENSYSLILIEQIIPKAPLKLHEIRGYIMNDYQDFLEKQWIERLKKKYSVNINQPLLDSLN